MQKRPVHSFAKIGSKPTRFKKGKEIVTGRIWAELCLLRCIYQTTENFHKFLRPMNQLFTESRNWMKSNINVILWSFL